MKLTIELIPSTSFYNNVRTNVSKSQWDKIRKKCYKEADYKCEICGNNGTNQGFKHQVECHEIWNYDESNHIQKLDGFIALCPMCHKTKHIGLAFINNQGDRVINHMMKVNKTNITETERYIKESFETFNHRSSYNWKVDITYIENYIK